MAPDGGERGQLRRGDGARIGFYFDFSYTWRKRRIPIKSTRRPPWSHTLAWLLALLAAAPAAAQAQISASEQEVKAAYLYRFLYFVEWPANRWSAPQAPLVIGVAGAPEIVDEMKRLVAGRSAQGHPIAVRAIAPKDPLESVHALYIGRDAVRDVKQLVTAAPHGALIVSDTEEGLDQGAAIAFVEIEGHIRFAVSLPAAQRAGIRISSRLLAVAVEVRKPGQ